MPAIHLLVRLLLVTCLVLIAAPASAQSEARRLYGRALAYIETGNRDAALQVLAPILNHLPDEPAKLGAHRLHAELSGKYQQRQKTWLNRKAADVVVLATDERSFVEAIELWTDEQFFPVLMDESWYAPMFIDEWKPSRIVRYTAEQPSDWSDEQLEAWIETHNRTIAQQHTADDRPPGLVVVEPDDPRRTAGLALAVGRGQPIVTLTNDKRPTSVVNAEAVAEMNNALLQALMTNELVQTDLLAGLTLVGDYPYRYRKQGQKGFLAVDDAIGRAANGLRVAATGRLTGSQAGTVYQAMCSLFLQPSDALLFDDYAARGAGFDRYRLAKARNYLQRGLEVDLLQGRAVTREAFGKAERYDLYWINSAGMSDWWQVESGKARATAADMPAGHAYLLLMVHSFSAANPYDGSTIGGRALLGGAWWYYGSVHEPYLHAFTTPGLVAARIAAGTPFGVALRQPLLARAETPWKLMTVGDPLFALRDQPAERVKANLSLNARSITSDADANPVQAYRNALLRGDEKVAAERAAAIMQAGQFEQPEDLWRAVTLLQKTGNTASLPELQPTDLAGNPIARERAWSGLLSQFRRTTKADPAAASAQVETLVQFAVRGATLQRSLVEWVQRMDTIGKGAHARRYLQLLVDDLKLDSDIATAVRAAAEH